MKLVDGRMVPLSSADRRQQQDDAARPAERVLVPWHLIVMRVLVLAGSAGADGLSVLVKSSPELMQKIMAARQGIYQDDADARAAFRAAGLDPDTILA